MMKKHAPFGCWPSTISADLVGGKTPRISEARVYGDAVFWLETQPEEKGRNAIMMQRNGETVCVLPRPLSSQSKVHEYGGGSYAVHGDDVYFVLADDQRIYHLSIQASIDGKAEPQAITPDDGRRYADLKVDAARNALIAVCEEHTDGGANGVANYLVSISLEAAHSIQTLHSGHDFYSNPEISPDGKHLSFLTWDHPNLPWDNTQLWCISLNDETPSVVGDARLIAGNGDESIFQPQWSEDGALLFVSDRENWWNIYECADIGASTPSIRAVTNLDAEFATPQWTFAMSTFANFNKQTLIAAYTQAGRWHLCYVDRASGELTTIDTTSSVIESVHAANSTAVFIGANPAELPAVFRAHEGQISALTFPPKLIDDKDVALPASMSYPTSDDQQSHLLFYPPTNNGFTSADEKPPVIVLSHGGPTGATESQLNFKIQFWTNRGFAVADVNYRGSTGYGREFRRSLYLKWGEYDVDDVCCAVDYLAKQGLIDPQRSIIKGSSAGGYTTLAALAFRDTFAAGVSLYGIGDLELLATDTHKFEARYMDQLVGPYPQEQALYKQRSPLNSVDKINCPLLVFQGLKDKVVPPNQAQAMVEATSKKGLAVAYVTYEDEAHGFRNPDNVQHMLDAELQFYSAIFTLPRPNTSDTPLVIRNREQLQTHEA